MRLQQEEGLQDSQILIDMVLGFILAVICEINYLAFKSIPAKTNIVTSWLALIF